jgi:hypothetical protein
MHDMLWSVLGSAGRGTVVVSGGLRERGPRRAAIRVASGSATHDLGGRRAKHFAGSVLGGVITAGVL